MFQNKSKKILIEKGVSRLFLLITLISIICILLISVFIFSNAYPAIKEIGLINFLFGTKWKPTDATPAFGILPMILASIYVTIGSIIIGFPIGISTAIFMSYFCPKKLYKPLKTILDLMAGIPSIIFGFFFLMAIVPKFRVWFGGSGMSLFTACVLLGVMILPTIISLSEASIKAVNRVNYEGALALGASHERAVLYSVIPAAKSGILASVILGIGRSIGETMAVAMISGNQAVIPTSLFDGVRTMTTNIVTGISYAQGLHRQALIATGAVLFVFILIINLMFNRVNRGAK